MLGLIVTVIIVGLIAGALRAFWFQASNTCPS